MTISSRIASWANLRLATLALGAGMLALAIGPAGAGKPEPGTVNWAVPGGGTDENHYSPLAQIDRATIKRLGVAWHADLDETFSSSEPVAADGKVYIAVGASVVHAYDVVTGKELWRFDPKVHESPEKTRLQATNWGIRGLAYDSGHVFVATKDGRLISLDARTGKPAWSTMTLDAASISATITGAPRVFDGKVIIGFGGADLGTTRGYVTAYDAKTGRQLWRFWTVPGDPAKGFENEAMATAAKTWTGEWWKYGGGGTAWHAITYDRELKQIYIGTGNGGPWNRKIRSPGGGDNLFLCSIVAVDAETGKYLWHYQTTPGESWDFNSVMDMELTHTRIGGKDVPVLYHAPKNGFFYVLDRRNGKLISADAWTKVTWATGIDANGRPIEAPNARYDHGPTAFYPGSMGAHNWLPMSTSARTGLVYIPETIAPGSYADVDIASYRPRPGIHGATGTDLTRGAGAAAGMTVGGGLVGWDPLARKARWRVPLPFYTNGGALSTAGGLVFQGRMDGKLYAYADDSGKPLWSYDTGGPLGTPIISYAWRGRQYITMLTGMAGGSMVTGELGASAGWDYRTYPRRLITFALGSRDKLPPRPARTPLVAAQDPGYRPDPATEARGLAIYTDRSCIGCHGPGAVGSGLAPDLRASPIPVDADAFRQVVQQGALSARGMPHFHDLSDDELAAIRQFLRAQAAALREKQARK